MIDKDKLTLKTKIMNTEKTNLESETSALSKGDVISSLLESVDRYDIWYGGGHKYARDEMQHDKRKNGDWVKWEDVEVILKELKANGL